MKSYLEEGPDGFYVGNHVKVDGGAKSASGELYVKFEQHEKVEFIKRNLFCPNVGPGIEELKKRGILVFLKRDQGKISDHVSEITLFREINIAERVGWSGLRFGLPNGEILSPSGETSPIAYQTGAVTVSVKGTAQQFRRKVAKFVQDQHIMLFCMMVSFAAPLLSQSRIQGNFGFMLSGPARKGKTTGLEVAAAVWGPVLDGPEGRYYLKFNNTQNRIEELMPFYNDMPLIIDELSSHGTRASRVDGFRTLVHHLAGVDAKGRYGDAVKPAEQTRTIVLISSNDGINELLASESADAAEGAIDRMFDIPVPQGDEGCFNRLLKK
jgi:hypothetical protein